MLDKYRRSGRPECFSFWRKIWIFNPVENLLSAAGGGLENVKKYRKINFQNNAKIY